jgi:hypothetical protein
MAIPLKPRYSGSYMLQLCYHEEIVESARMKFFYHARGVFQLPKNRQTRSPLSPRWHDTSRHSFVVVVGCKCSAATTARPNVFSSRYFPASSNGFLFFNFAPSGLSKISFVSYSKSLASLAFVRERAGLFGHNLWVSHSRWYRRSERHRP